MAEAVPDTTNGLPVTGIGAQPFYQRTSLTQLPNGSVNRPAGSLGVAPEYSFLVAV